MKIIDGNYLLFTNSRENNILMKKWFDLNDILFMYMYILYINNTYINRTGPQGSAYI